MTIFTDIVKFVTQITPTTVQEPVTYDIYHTISS